jgi:hypothetical protein
MQQCVHILQTFSAILNVILNSVFIHYTQVKAYTYSLDSNDSAYAMPTYGILSLFVIKVSGESTLGCF